MKRMALTMKKGTAFNKICKPEWLCPGIHFLLSFFYEWTILLLHPEVITVAAVAKNSEISDATERIMSYALSKALAGVFIFLGWRLFFTYFGNGRKRSGSAYFSSPMRSAA